MMHLLRLTRGSSRLALAAATASWLAAACIGIAMLTAYSNIPGPASRTSADWPAGTRLELNRTGATLIVFAHPQCPCSRATVGELEKIEVLNHGELQTYVVFIEPQSVGDDWDDTDL